MKLKLDWNQKQTGKIVIKLIIRNSSILLSFFDFRKYVLSPTEQLLLTLRYYSSGNFLITVADFLGVSKSSASRVVKRVSNVIAGLRRKYIQIPNTREKQIEMFSGFYRIAKFPRVLGTIDGTHVKMQSPGKLQLV